MSSRCTKETELASLQQDQYVGIAIADLLLFFLIIIYAIYAKVTHVSENTIEWYM